MKIMVKNDDRQCLSVFFVGSVYCGFHIFGDQSPIRVCFVWSPAMVALVAMSVREAEDVAAVAVTAEEETNTKFEGEVAVAATAVKEVAANNAAEEVDDSHRRGSCQEGFRFSHNVQISLIGHDLT